MLTTLIAPTAGRARVAGHDVVDRAGRRPPADRLRRPGQRRRPQPARPRRARHPGPDLRARQGGRPGPRRRAGRRRCELRRGRRPQGHPAVRRPASPARHRDGSDPRAASCCSSTSRRPASTRRTGPTCRSTSCALRERPRDHGRADHALPRRGRRAGRADRDRRPRPGRRRRHPAAAQGRRTPATRSRCAFDSASADAPRGRRHPPGRPIGGRVPHDGASAGDPGRRRAGACCPQLLRELDADGTTAGAAEVRSPDARRRLPRAHRPQPARRPGPAGAAPDASRRRLASSTPTTAQEVFA